MSISFGISGVLFLVFLVLKLTQTINWSWWWVTAPLWLPLVLWMVLWIIVTVYVAVYIAAGGL